MTAKICFFLACTTFTICCYTCCLIEIGNVSDLSDWNKLDPVAREELFELLLNERKKTPNEQRLTDYEQFISTAALIPRIGEVLYKEVTKYLKSVFIFKYKYEYKPHRGANWFQSEFNDWRIRTYQPITKNVHPTILRICPENKIKIGRINQREYIDFIQHSGSELAQNLRNSLPEHKWRYVAALIPSSYRKMCTYLHEEGSLALLMFENGTVYSLFDALMTYNHWKFSSRDIRYLNIILSALKMNFRLKVKITKHDDIVFPVASFNWWKFK